MKIKINKKYFFILPIGALILVGIGAAFINGQHLMGSLHSSSMNLSAKNQNIPTPQESMFPDNISPVVTIDSPSEGQIIHGENFTIYARAKDNVAVTKVEFYLGFTKVSTLSKPDSISGYYKYSFDTTAQQNDTPLLLSVWAYDQKGNIGKKTISYRVDNFSLKLICSIPIALAEAGYTCDENGYYIKK